MGKIKDIWNGEHRSFVRYAVYATAVFVVLVGFVNQDNIVRWIKADIELKQQARQIERYQKEIDEMDRKIQMISNDRDTLERFAREHFGFAKDGDDVYIIEKKQ
ncbi:MAG: septum formation initiator family protein [Bacteroidales bacterium]|jgi:cell division protein FtsB|nr:septum formation initiator family protein [Bacteroidales bacterium]MBQ9172734.1 septum formation initiator family protein [Bacteroidales bacterium]MBR1435712.1 septum formation initiator family protein [Bacteroidales bacterium]MBR6417052.1 septum formation initiator family protein [Bacteroidales bacterium]